MFVAVHGDSDDGWVSYGYSSLRGKRASMEDCYSTKISEIDGKTIGLFGVFDGEKLTVL